MRRGEIWTVAGGSDYAGKPRPAVILQDDRFDTDSVTVCPFTTDTTEALLFRVEIEPGAENGLSQACRLMVDKITTVRRSALESIWASSRTRTSSGSTAPSLSFLASRRADEGIARGSPITRTSDDRRGAPDRRVGSGYLQISAR